ncbi:MAG: PTS glucose transporter subunit IIA [Nocardioidaceae bacterium]|nr:PTS glucose transporter subunit IIA [Nocardioidaceae bacterium]NUS52492.1 PTS glucose transporter subunit IIA [Nocardioidaceae bacterium]
MTARRTRVLAPVSGTSLDVADVPDPVFASGMVGPGVAIDPDRRPQVVVAPIAGRLVKLHPHAFVVLGPDGVGVLVHLGIDTVRLQGAGFRLLAAEDDEVTAGQRVLDFDPAYVAGAGCSPICAVVVMDCPLPAVPVHRSGAQVGAAEPIFDIGA